jgi:hypothetical protein
LTITPPHAGLKSTENAESEQKKIPTYDGRRVADACVVDDDVDTAVVLLHRVGWMVRSADVLIKFRVSLIMRPTTK